MTKSVLIVEDEFIVANDLRLILEQAGYKVNGIAASAAEAAESRLKNKPDIVLLDIQLEGRSSGIDIARELRVENIPFIYISANSNIKVLEEVKTTEPFGFIVKPFRKKDLLVTLDIAWYRHEYGLESKLRQEVFLQKQIADTAIETLSEDQSLLKIARLLQQYIPFDLISSGFRSSNMKEFNDIAYLRIGFDEYQYIGKKELLTITRLKENDLSANEQIKLPLIFEKRKTEKVPLPSLSKIYLDNFNLKSCLIYPIELPNNITIFYNFSSRQSNIYTDGHIALLNRLKLCLTTVAEYLVNQISNKSSIPLTLPGKEDNMIASNPAFKNVIGNHHLLLSALDLTAQVAPYNTSVLIQGESGTGKEKIAQLIHSLSPRVNEPFVKVNCAAIPPTLIESELFGHEKGAFTGAIEKRKGRFEQAHGGTIFLDEIGELPLGMQVKLLRVLQEKEIEPVGSSATMKVNVRIVAATNQNLETEVSKGRFRLDLYYRLNVFPITLPPLRERKTDITALALYFATKFCKEFNKPFLGITTSMMEELQCYHWPGNIRELGNIMEQAVILNDGKSKLEIKRNLSGTTPGLDDKTNLNTLEDVKHFQQETERGYIISVLKKANGRIRGANGAAEILNIKPTTLESKIIKLKISKEDLSK